MCRFSKISISICTTLAIAGVACWFIAGAVMPTPESHGAVNDFRDLPLFTNQLGSIRASSDWIWVMRGTARRHEFLVSVHCSEFEATRFADAHKCEMRDVWFSNADSLLWWQHLIESVRGNMTAIPSHFDAGDLYWSGYDSIFYTMDIAYRRRDGVLVLDCWN
jgi:hypothetical protein